MGDGSSSFPSTGRSWTSFPAGSVERIWRIPFSHHPPFSAGPRHHNTRTMVALLPLLQRAGVKVMFSGHEHNFQHSSVTASTTS